MKLDQLLNKLQAHSEEVKQEIFCEEMSDQSSSTIEANGIMAIGGCRKCFRTFTDRLQLIHHMVDHFPSIFYSFESLTQSDVMQSIDSEFFSQLTAILNSDNADSKTEQVVKSTKKSNNSGSKPQLVEPVESMEAFKSTDYYHMCPYCCSTFSDSTTFENHTKTHSSSNAFSSPIFKCDQCEVKCINRYLLEEHRRLHRKICYICGEQFDTLFDLNLHVGEHLGLPYSCKDCGKCFSSRKILAEHNQSHRLINVDHQNSDKLVKKATVTDENDEKPRSLLVSNVYFNGLAKNITRRRRYKPSRTNQKAENPNNSKISQN